MAAQANPPSAAKVRAMKSALAAGNSAADQEIVAGSDLCREARELGAVMRRELPDEFLARLIAFLAAASPNEIGVLKGALRKATRQTNAAAVALATTGRC